MGREIRRVPPWWEHLRDESGNYLPLFDRSYDEAVADYEYALRMWVEGCHPSQLKWPAETEGFTYDTWDGGPPDPRVYRQESWREDQATCWQLYENVSEGTPVSPKFERLPDLLAWLRANGYAKEDVQEIERIGRLPTGRISFVDEDREG